MRLKIQNIKIVTLILGLTIGQFSFAYQYECSGNIVYNHKKFLQQNIEIQIACTNTMDHPDSPQVLWNWGDHRVHFSRDNFTSLVDQTCTWHETMPGLDDERLVTRAMFRFDFNSREYFIIDNEIVEKGVNQLFSQGICHAVNSP